MFYGKARMLVGFSGTPQYFTRKDYRFIKFWHPHGPGKKNKVGYHRKMRRGKYRLYDFKNSQWKKLPFTDPWNWD